MGLLQDLEVTQWSLRAFIQEHPGAEELLRPFAGYLKTRRARALRSFLNSADRLYEFWPPKRKENGELMVAQQT